MKPLTRELLSRNDEAKVNALAHFSLNIRLTGERSTHALLCKDAVILGHLAEQLTTTNICDIAELISPTGAVIYTYKTSRKNT